MSEPTAIPAGTRVEITDPKSEWHKLTGQILESGPDTIVAFEHWGRTTDLFRPDQFRILSPPEPTVGQLYDRLTATIERVCEQRTWAISTISLRSDCFGGQHRVAVKFSGQEWMVCDGATPQAALLAMTERLEGLEGGAEA